MNNPAFSYAATSERTAFDAGLRAHMLRVYQFMAGGVGLSGVVAWAGATFAPALMSGPIGLLFMLAPLGFMMFLSFRIQQMSLGTAQGIFWAFCAAMGLSLSTIFLVYTSESIARTFFITAATFGAMTLWGYTTKADLSKMGAFLMMGVFGLMIASLVNIGMALFTGSGSSMLQWVISLAGVAIFTLLTAWDTQRIKQTYAEHWGVEANGKLAVMGALSLYLNFINAFQFLLQLIGTRRE